MACMVWDLLFAPLISTSTAMQRGPLWPAWFGISSLPLLQCRGNQCGLHGLRSPRCSPHQRQYCNAEVNHCGLHGLRSPRCPPHQRQYCNAEVNHCGLHGLGSPLCPSSMPLLQCRGKHCGLHGLGSPEGTNVACMV